MLRLVHLWIEDPDISNMLHNLILVLATGLGKKTGELAGSALASALSLVLGPLVSILRFANYLTTPQALFSSVFKILGHAAKKIRPGNEAQATLQIIELFTGGLFSADAWLNMLASNAAVLPLAGGDLAKDQVSNLLKNKDQVLALIFNTARLLLIEPHESCQFPNGDPLASEDDWGFLSPLNPNNNDGSALGLGYEALELSQALLERPSLQAQLFQKLFGSIGTALGYENLLRCSPENKSSWLSFVPKITLSSLSSPPESNSESKEDWREKEVEWKRIEDTARMDINMFNETITSLKNNIEKASKDELGGILIHIQCLDAAIQKAETKAIASYKARILFDNQHKGSFRENSIKSLYEAVERRRLVFKRQEVANKLQNEIDTTIRFTSFINSKKEEKSKISYEHLKTCLDPKHKNFILNKVFSSYDAHVNSSAWYYWGDSLYTKETAQFKTEIDDFFKKIEGMQKLILNKELTSEIINSLKKIRVQRELELKVNNPEVREEDHDPSPEGQDMLPAQPVEAKSGKKPEDNSPSSEEQDMLPAQPLEEKLGQEPGDDDASFYNNELFENQHQASYKLVGSFPNLSKAKNNLDQECNNERRSLFSLSDPKSQAKKKSLQASIELSTEVMKALRALHTLEENKRQLSTEAKQLQEALGRLNDHIKTQSIGRPGSCSKKVIGALLGFLGAVLITLDLLGVPFLVDKGIMCLIGGITTLAGGILFFKGTKSTVPTASLSCFEENAKQAQQVLLLAPGNP